MQRPLPFGQDVRGGGEVVDEVALRMPNRARAGPADPGCGSVSLTLPLRSDGPRRSDRSGLHRSLTRYPSRLEFYTRRVRALPSSAVTLTIEVTYTLCLS